MKIVITENQLDSIINKGILSESKKPTKYQDIIKFQNFAKSKNFKNLFGPKKGQLISADGSWGPNSEAAWRKYSKTYGVSKDPQKKLEYPFNIIARGATVKEIAKIIKDSNGGWFRNDYEDWAEAAFNSIKTKDRYNQISKLLGKDVFEYISDYMKTSKVHHEGPSIDETRNKLFNNIRVGTSGDKSKKPTKYQDIIKFQNFAKSKNFKNLFGPKKGQLISADGSWGPNSEAAWSKYSSEYVKSRDQKTNVKTGDISWLKSASNQVKKQVQYLINGGFKQKFTLLDDKNSKVYAINNDYSLYGVYNVITGKDRGDQVKDVTFGDWYRENPISNTWKFLKTWYKESSMQKAVEKLDSEYFNTKMWVTKNTPSGIFTADKSPGNWLESTVMTHFAEKDYGKRFIGFENLDGQPIAVGFHGTKNPKRIDITKDDWSQAVKNRGGKFSFGCVNFKDADIQKINSFITDGQYSFWLPDASNGIAEFPDGIPQSGILSNILSLVA